MKRSVLTVMLLLAGVACLHAETIKLKSGRFVSGSILSQTEYTLNLATSYGNITLNQREIEQILPDQYRVYLKGGTQLIGSVLDMDEFNLKLQTDDGIVNVDMPQIVSMETYDYDQGKEQREFVQQKAQQEESARQAAQAAREQAAGQTAPDAANRPAVLPQTSAAGGLQFDEDIDRVFETKKPQVVNGSVVTPDASYQEYARQQAAKPMTDEEAFLKGVKTGSVSQQEYATAAKQELASKKPAKKKETASRTQEAQTNKYFAIELGAMPLDLKLDNSSRTSYDDGSYDVGGTSVVASSKFLWRVAGSNLWLGPTLSIANIANNSFADLDPDVAAANQAAAANNQDIPYPDATVKTSGQILNIGATANYYLNPRGRVAFYLTASAGYEMLTLNYRGAEKSDSIKSNGFSFSGGVGAEMLVDDVLLGVEARQVFATRSDALKDSSSSNTAIMARVSWKF